MLYNDLYNLLTYIYTYLVIYNISMTLFILVLHTTSSYFSKTLSSLKFINNVYHKKYTVIVVLFSLAGIPPFIGFYTKLNIISLLGNSSYLFLLVTFFFFFAVLFFYLQNLRYVLIPNYITVKDYSLFDIKKKTLVIFFMVFGLALVCFGSFLLDDIVLFISWLMI